jgi:short-subunit dehydrogenase
MSMVSKPMVATTSDPDHTRATRPSGNSQEGRGHTALVTGASAGIGHSFSHLLASRGYDLVVVARRRERLEALQKELSSAYGVHVDVICVDLGDPAACRTIKQELDRIGITVDFLVNNAGYSVLGFYADVDWQRQEAYIRVLGLSVLELTYYLLPGMLQRGWGRIINVTSMCGFFEGSPGQTLYAPIKSMIHKFSESIALEYESQGIICTSAPPGATDTEILETAGSGAMDFVANNRLVRAAMMRPEAYTKAAYKGCMAGHRVVIPGLRNKIWGFTLLHSPPGVRYAMCKFMAKLTMLDK